MYAYARILYPTVNISSNFISANKNPIFGNNGAVKVPRNEQIIVEGHTQKNRLQTLDLFHTYIDTYTLCISQRTKHCVHFSFSNVKWNQFDLPNGFFGQCSKWSRNVVRKACLTHGIWPLVFAAFYLPSFFSGNQQSLYALNSTWNNRRTLNFIFHWLLKNQSIVL